MGPLLARLGPLPSLQRQVVLPHLTFVLLQLPFKTQVGQNLRSARPHEGDGVLEVPVIFLHQVGDYEGGTLGEEKNTLEMPAAQ